MLDSLIKKYEKEIKELDQAIQKDTLLLKKVRNEAHYLTEEEVILARERKHVRKTTLQDVLTDLIYS